MSDGRSCELPPDVPSQRIWSEGRAVTCGDRFVRDALRGGFSDDGVRRSWMPNLLSIDLGRPSYRGRCLIHYLPTN